MFRLGTPSGETQEDSPVPAAFLLQSFSSDLSNLSELRFLIEIALPSGCRGEYFTKFPDNYRGKVSPEDQVLGKSLLISGNLLCNVHTFGEEFAKTIREKLSVFS